MKSGKQELKKKNLDQNLKLFLGILAIIFIFIYMTIVLTNDIKQEKKATAVQHDSKRA